MRTKFRLFLKDRSGASAIEYAVIAGIVSVAGFGALMQTGGSLQALLDSVSLMLINLSTLPL
ncbi:MAG: Flp family type IVb pilin [Alphaproteobacteria bacterium]|nr:MAG: Flp family type IVb pilin [Alphaproteobacteria bacterium]